MRVHPDTYLPRLSAFTTYDGVTMPQSHEWDDAATPRTDAPVRFMYSLSNAYTYRQARSKPTGSGKAFLGYPA